MVRRKTLTRNERRAERLIDGKPIRAHDLTLQKHEKMEQELMQQGYTQDEAHRKTSKIYNYRKESDVYYAKADKHKSS